MNFSSTSTLPAESRLPSLPWFRICLLVLAGCLIGWIAGQFMLLAILMLLVASIHTLVRTDWIWIALFIPACAGFSKDPYLLIPGGICGLTFAAWISSRIIHRDFIKELPTQQHITNIQGNIKIIERHLNRFPILQQSCIDVGKVSSTDELAHILVQITQKVVPHIIDIQMWIDTDRGRQCRAGFAKPGPIGSKHSDLVNYSWNLWKSHIHRRAGNTIITLPMGEPFSSDNQSYRCGLLALEFTSFDLEDHFIFEITEALGLIGNLGLESLALMEEARSLALYDDLTGLFGKHEFHRRLDEQVSHVRRKDDSLGIIMCDLDHLKSFNDHYGHQAGDEALRCIAQTIKAHTPSHGIACRYGGEEFCILLPFTRGSAIQSLAETLHQAIRSTTPLPEQPEIHLTASLGWAVLGNTEQAWEVLKRADDACYLAKANGRDRVEAADVIIDDVEVINPHPVEKDPE